jgi:hypothetical protein
MPVPELGLVSPHPEGTLCADQTPTSETFFGSETFDLSFPCRHAASTSREKAIKKSAVNNSALFEFIL